MRKKIVTILIAVAAVLVGVGATLAYLVASSRPVINLFTIGDIQLELTETTGNAYSMIPGTTVTKDPRLTVKANSDACWLFMRVEKSATFDRYMTYAIADGWIALADVEGVYYRSVNKTTSDVTFPLLAGDKVTVLDTVTEGEMAAITKSPTLTFFGYAIQAVGVESAGDAWQLLQGGAMTNER